LSYDDNLSKRTFIVLIETINFLDFLPIANSGDALHETGHLRLSNASTACRAVEIAKAGAGRRRTLAPLQAALFGRQAFLFLRRFNVLTL
jgi:hypothetical protein